MKFVEIAKREREVFRPELLFRTRTFRIFIQINFSYYFKKNNSNSVANMKACSNADEFEQKH